MKEFLQNYHPWAHLLFPSLFGISFLFLSIIFIENIRLWELCFIPLFWVFHNLSEWQIHRLILHKKMWPLSTLYTRHIEHHARYTNENMSIQSVEEFRFVLIPFYGIIGILLANLPFALTLYFFAQYNLAMIYIVVAMLYVLSYEWLHLAYHLPKKHWISQMKWLQVLQHHHATHHIPTLMNRWNFNVTLPFGDFLQKTIYDNSNIPTRSFDERIN